MTTIPLYSDDPFWEPQDAAEAVELASSHQEAGLDPADYPGAFGSYADLASADLPWVVGEATPVDMSNASEATADLAGLQPGTVVEWEQNGVIGYGLLDEIDSTNSQARIQPLELAEDGTLVRSPENALMKPLLILSPSDKKLSTTQPWNNQIQPFSPAASTERNLSDRELYRNWLELSGVDADEEGADLAPAGSDGEEFTLTPEREAQDALREELRRQSAERDSGPDPETDEKSRGLLSAWRRLFYGREDA